MKTLEQTIRQEVENQFGIETFEVENEVSIMVEGREKIQVLPENVAETVLEDFRNHSGFPAKYFEFDGTTYYFVEQ